MATLKTVLILAMVLLFIGCEQRKPQMSPLDCSMICPYGVKKYTQTYPVECECFQKGGVQ